jgi:pimeloyl-ACP methyl ester carboxylesterase
MTRHRAFAALLLAMAMLAACAGAAVPPAAAGDVAGPIDIGGGRHLYLECRGSGGPTVVLESGYHDSADLWNLSDVKAPVDPEPVLAGIARSARVCAYDRPGHCATARTRVS